MRSLRPRAVLRRTRSLQILLIGMFYLMGEGLVRGTGLPVPGGVVGLGLLELVLALGLVEAASIRRGASWLLAQMLLFFVPAAIAIIDHREFISALGLKVVLVIVVGTLLVMTGTALTVDLLYRWRMRHAVE